MVDVIVATVWLVRVMVCACSRTVMIFERLISAWVMVTTGGVDVLSKNKY